MRFWLSKGCDGFRVDMAGSLVKNDEESKGTIALWQDIRGFLEKAQYEGWREVIPGKHPETGIPLHWRYAMEGGDIS